MILESTIGDSYLSSFFAGGHRPAQERLSPRTGVQKPEIVDPGAVLLRYLQAQEILAVVLALQIAEGSSATAGRGKRGLECHRCGCKHFHMTYTRPT